MPIEVVDVELEKLKTRYMAALHAVQSGVAMTIEIHGEEHQKHIRVGINSAMVNDRAVVSLLIAKGIITEIEHMEALVKAAEDEKATYETALTNHFGKPVKLA